MAMRPTNPTSVEAEKWAHGSPAMIEEDRASAFQRYLERYDNAAIETMEKFWSEQQHARC